MTDVSVEVNLVSMTISTGTDEVSVSTGTPVVKEYEEDRDPFTGDYEVTPSTETQILETIDLRMTDNVTINPIPSYYGLITWDGSTITVS